jgi:hypothetical protein
MKKEGYHRKKGTKYFWYLRMYISLQKSSIFSVVRSCSRNNLMATSVPFHIPRKTSPKNPDGEFQ